MQKINKLYKLLGRKFFVTGRTKERKNLIEIQKCLEDIYLLEKNFGKQYLTSLIKQLPQVNSKL